MSRKTYSKKFLNIDLLTAPAVFKAPKSCSVATAFFEHVLRSVGAHALEPVQLFVWQCFVSWLSHVLVLEIVVCWRFEVLLFS